MSHNLNTINARSPSREGLVTQSWANLSDTTGTPTNNQALARQGSAWEPATIPENSVCFVRHIAGQGEGALTAIYNPALENGWFFAARAIGSSGAFLSVTQDTSFATVYYRVFATNAQYFEHIELQAGHVYFLYLEFCIGGNSGAGASIELQWQDDNGNALGPRAFCRQKGENRTPLRGVIDLTSSSGTTSVGLQRVGSGVNGSARYCLTADDVAQFNVSVRILI